MPIQFLEPWYGVDDAAMGGALERQLGIEVGERHRLYRVPVKLIVRRQDCDDALFALADGRVAEVHMTWRRGVEDDPRWPSTAIFASLEEWAAVSMEPTHRHWRENGWLD